MKKNLISILKNRLFFIVAGESFLCEKKFFHIIIGLIDTPTKTYLIKSSIQNKINAENVKNLIFSTLNEFELDKKNFILYLTDGARYMISSGSLIKEFLPDLFHVSCMTHLLHNCTMKIKNHFSDVDYLIGRIKMALAKSNERKSLFKNIPLSPDTIITRWESWLLESGYYAQYLPEITKIVESFENDGIIVENVKKAVKNENLIRSLCIIKKEYEFITECLKKCENITFTINDVCQFLKNIQIENDVANIEEYFNDRFKKNDIYNLINMKNSNISPLTYSLLLKCQ